MVIGNVGECSLNVNYYTVNIYLQWNRMFEEGSNLIIPIAQASNLNLNLLQVLNNKPSLN